MRLRPIVAVALVTIGVLGGWRSVAAQEMTGGAANTPTTSYDPSAELAPEAGAYPVEAEQPTGDDAPEAPVADGTEAGSPDGASTDEGKEAPAKEAPAKDKRCRDRAVGGRGSVVPPCPTEELRNREVAGSGWDIIWGPVRRVLDGWFLSLARAALDPILKLLADTVFATPDVTVPGTVRDYWTYSLVLADTVLVLLVVIAGLVLMGHETVQTRTTVKEVAPRLLFAVVAAHTSLGFAGMLIRAANALSAGFLGDFDPKSGHMATEGLFHIVLGVIAGGNIFLAILGIAVAALGIGVLCTYLARVANIVVLVGAAPLFLIAHAVPQLEGAARLWWRNLIGCLGIQVCQSLVMSATLRVFFHDDGSSLAGMPGGGLMDLLLVGSLLFLMLRIPSYAGRLIFAPRSSNTITQQVGNRVVSGGIGAVTKAAS